jgi:Thioesterase-like superfamily
VAYFVRAGRSTFAPTGHVGGAWDADEQHIAPSLGLLLHVVEADRDARRDDGLVVGRLSYDILGTMPLDLVETTVTVVRPGRTIELVEATLACRGRCALQLRAWLMRPGDTTAVAATSLPRIAGPDVMRPWDPATVWAGGFVTSVEVRRAQVEPGRAAFWVRPRVPLG